MISEIEIKMLSIIVPIYNIKEYLPKCLDSIVVQNFEDMETILVDDGSTDGCASICDEYALNNPRMRVIHQENGGLVNARKRGLSEASGEFIMFVDGDDWLEPDACSVMMDMMEREKTDVVIACHYVNMADGQTEARHGVREGRYEGGLLVGEIFPRMIIGEDFFDWIIYPGFWAKLFRRDKLSGLLIDEDERIVMGEDAAVVYPYLLLCNSIYICNKPVYHYRQSLSSMVKIHVDTQTERMRYNALYNSGRSFFENHTDLCNLTEEWRKYVMFLAVPRLDVLYDGFDMEDELVPFTGVKRGMRIVLYGSGTYGQRLANAINRTHMCTIAHWVDRNYKQYRDIGLEVEPPDVLNDKDDFDAIIVANTYYRSRMGLYEQLVKKYPREKVHLIDVDRILSEEIFFKCGLGS